MENDIIKRRELAKKRANRLKKAQNRKAVHHPEKISDDTSEMIMEEADSVISGADNAGQTIEPEKPDTGSNEGSDAGKAFGLKGLPSGFKRKSSAHKAKKVSSRTPRARRIAKRKIEIMTITIITLLVLFGGMTWKTEIQPKGGFLWIKSEVTGGAIVSDRVLSYEDDITAYAEEEGIESYVQIIEAIMQQESGGKGTDVMQCSECYLNTRYVQTPGSIDDPEYSIEIGVKYFAKCLELAECKSINDTRRLRLALQGYNFGHNYISWAIENYGGYTIESAQEFSKMMAESMEWDSYGDVNYVDHVLRYYKKS